MLAASTKRNQVVTTLTFYVGLKYGHGHVAIEWLTQLSEKYAKTVENDIAKTARACILDDWEGVTETRGVGYWGASDEPCAVFTVLLPGRLHLSEGERDGLCETIERIARECWQESVLCVVHDGAGVPELFEATTVEV